MTQDQGFVTVETEQDSQVSIDSEVVLTEFAQRCYDIRIQWIGGEIPFQEALSRLDGCMREALSTSSPAKQAMVEYQLGYIHHYHGNIESSIYHYQHSRALFQQVGNQEYVARMELNLGEEYRYKGEFDRALAQFRVACAVGREINNLSLQAFAMLNTGWVLLDFEAWSEARQSLAQAELLVGQMGDYWQKDGVLAEVYYGLSIVALRLADAATAWKYALSLVALADRNPDARFRGYANRLLGELITELKTAPDPIPLTSPDDYFFNSIQAFQEIRFEAEIARTLFAQACSLALRDARVDAVRKFQQAMLIFNRLGMTKDAARAVAAQSKLV